MHSFVPRAKMNGKVGFYAWFPLNSLIFNSCNFYRPPYVVCGKVMFSDMFVYQFIKLYPIIFRISHDALGGNRAVALKKSLTCYEWGTTLYGSFTMLLFQPVMYKWALTTCLCVYVLLMSLYDPWFYFGTRGEPRNWGRPNVTDEETRLLPNQN